MNPFEERQEKLKWFLSEPQEPAAAPPVAGRKIGRYRLVEILGEGGMGVVFRAVDEELGREVALKMLKTAQIYSATQIERFQREARSTARLRHPGIATLHEIGHHEDSMYLVLELVRGKPFDLRGGELAARVAVLEQVARAVHYAHEQGVIHRDLKPGNILVDPEGVPHLLDFGLSRDAEGPSDLTRSGAFVGTPAYTAPEQAEGRIREIGPRTDVYSLGAILYEVLAGRAPATGETIAQILRQVTTEEPARPQGPADLVTICLKAIEKSPARRYASAAEFADDLGRFLKGEPIAARPLSRSARFVRAARKHRALLVPAGLAGLLLLVTGVWALRELGRGARVVLDDFEHTPQNWKLAAGEEFPGAKGELVVDEAVAHGGRRSWRLSADFRDGGRYVGAWRYLPSLDGRDLDTLRFWVKSADLARLMMRIEDATLQCHQKSVVLLPGPDWQEIVIRVADLVGGEHWGGANDGAWHGPAHGLGIHISINMFRDPASKRGVFWLDDLEGTLR